VDDPAPDESPAGEPPAAEAPATSSSSKWVVIALLAVAILAGVFVAKIVAPSDSDGGNSASTPSLTATHNDAVADYQAALKSGRPVYVLFHSLN